MSDFRIKVKRNGNDVSLKVADLCTEKVILSCSAAAPSGPPGSGGGGGCPNTTGNANDDRPKTCFQSNILEIFATDGSYANARAAINALADDAVSLDNISGLFLGLDLISFGLCIRLF